MAEFRGGPNMYADFVYSGGTISFATQYRNISITDEADMIDSTAGAVSFREFIAGLRQVTVAVEALHNGTASPFGTADIAALAPGGSGTVRVAPFGTATGQAKYSGAALIKNRNHEYPYDDVVPLNVEFQVSGTWSEGAW